MQRNYKKATDSNFMILCTTHSYIPYVHFDISVYSHASHFSCFLKNKCVDIQENTSKSQLNDEIRSTRKNRV
jgi:hypothetical protein